MDKNDVCCADTEDKNVIGSASEPEKKPSKKVLKVVLPVAAVFALIIVLAIVFGVLLSRGGSAAYDGITTKFWESIRMKVFGDNFLLLTTEGDVIEINEYKNSTYTLSGNGEKAVMAVYDENGNAKLCYCDGKMIEVISDSIQCKDSFRECVLISYDGSTVYYKKSLDDDYYYVYSGGKSKKAFKAESITAMSPDGKSVGYWRETQKDQEAVRADFFYCGREYQLGENDESVFAISNGAKYIYIKKYFETEERGFVEYYVQKGKIKASRVKLVSDGINEFDNFYFNGDLSQIIYRCSEGVYISDHGKEAKKISDRTNVTPYCIPYVSYICRMRGLIVCDGYIFPIESFFGHPFEIDSTNTTTEQYIWYLSDKYEFQKSEESFPLNTSSFLYSRDYKSVGYVYGNTLYRLNLTGLDERATVIDDLNVSQLVAFLNDNTVFYLTDDGNLYSKKDSEERIKVAEGQPANGYNYTTYIGDCIYWGSGGKLMYSTGGPAETVPEISNIYYISECMIVTDDAFYMITEGPGFVKIADRQQQEE